MKKLAMVSGLLILVAVIITSAQQKVDIAKITASATGTQTAANSDSIVCATDTRCIVTGSGTAGTAASGVVTVQGIASMTPLLTSGTGTAGTAASAVTTVQGIASMTPVQVSQATASNLNATVVGTGTLAVQSQPTPVTSGGLSNYVVQPGASDNHANIKNGAGQVYFIHAYSIHTAALYMRLYNAASGFNGCNSATNIIWEGIIPGAATGAGLNVDISSGIAFGTGISICVTGAYGQTDTTSATASVAAINVGYK